MAEQPRKDLDAMITKMNLAKQALQGLTVVVMDQVTAEAEMTTSIQIQARAIGVEIRDVATLRRIIRGGVTVETT